MSDEDDNTIASPLTALDQEAVRIHEVYLSYMEAGFPEQRAFELVCIILDHFLNSDDD